MLCVCVCVCACVFTCFLCLCRDGIARMSYQLLLPDETDPNLIILTSLGQITTSGINGHAVVMVTSYESESSFNQSISIHVEVCPVSSLALTPPPSLPQATPNSKYHSFPLGYSAEFTADLHDNKGRKFSRSAINIKYRLNRLAPSAYSKYPGWYNLLVATHSWLVQSPGWYTHLTQSLAHVKYSYQY